MSKSNNILVGSSYFFSQYEDYQLKDRDYVVVVDESNDFKFNREIHIKDKCIFELKRCSCEEIIKRIDSKGSPMQIGKFLVPEFNKEIGFEFKDIELLRPSIERIDRKHSYEKIIFESYIENGDFILTNEQRLLAYKEYKLQREQND